MKPGKETVEALLALPDEEAARIVREPNEAALARLAGDWPAWVHARHHRRPPPPAPRRRARLAPPTRPPHPPRKSRLHFYL